MGAGVLPLPSRQRAQPRQPVRVSGRRRFLGLLAGAFIVLHGGALLLDGYLPFSLGSLLIPGIAPYRPLAVALGIVGAELLAALAIANRYRKQLPYRFWRRTHYLNFAVWVLALGHGIAAGTDSTTLWALALYVVSGSLVVGLTVRRVLRAFPVQRWALRFWPGTAAVVTAELIVVLALGPLRHHAG